MFEAHMAEFKPIRLDLRDLITEQKMKDEKIIIAQNSSKNYDLRIDENNIAALRDIISTCKQKKIKLIFVQSPIFISKQNSFCDSAFSELCSKNDIRYYNFSNHKTFNNHSEYFADRSHLNDDGAKVFSNLLINKIRLNN